LPTGAQWRRHRNGTSERPRPRLHALLDAAAAKPLTLLSAGPGWGKTTLVSNWLARRPEATAWVTMDRTRSHEAGFWGSVIEAVDAQALLGPTQAESPGPRAARPDVGPIAENALALLGDVLETTGYLLLVVDDAHLLTDPEILQALDSVIRFPLPGLRIVLAARKDPPLALHLYRLDDRVAEIRSAELAMNLDEIADALRAQHIVPGPGDVEELLHRTLGWPAAVHLAALNLAGPVQAGRGELRRRLLSLRAPELMDSVLDSLPAEQLHMLVDASVLREISGGLADALSGRTDSRVMLQRLADSNFFITPLDREQDWFRFHPMLQENLARRRAARDGGSADGLHRRAAAWFESEGRVVSAMEQLALVADWAALARLLTRGGLAQCLAAGGPGVRQLLADLAHAVIPTDPSGPQATEVLAARGVARIICGDVEAARQDLAQITHDRDIPMGVGLLVGYMETELYYLDAAVERARGRLASYESERRLARPDVVAAASYANLAALELWAQPFPAPTASLTRAWQLCREAGAVVHELRCLGLLTFAHAASGQLRLASTFDAAAAESIRAIPTLNGRAVMAVHLGTAALALQRGDWDRGRRAVERARATSWSPTDEPLAAATRCVEAKLLMAQGQVVQGLRLLPASDATQPLLAVRNMCDETYLDLAIAAGERAPGEEAPRRPARRSPELTLRNADWQFARGNWSLASALISEAMAASDPTAQLPTLVDAMLLTAALAHRRGHARSASVAAHRAVELAADGVRLPFHRRADQLAGLLAAQPALAAVWPIPLNVDGDRPRRLPNEPPVEALTARERDVLAQLALPMNTTEVAESLAISVNTLKTHSGALYRKLGVSQRQDAVARGYELGLL
jgi:LuxR family maltose regulon positive regulatory protein